LCGLSHETVVGLTSSCGYRLTHDVDSCRDLLTSSSPRAKSDRPHLATETDCIVTTLLMLITQCSSLVPGHGLAMATVTWEHGRPVVDWMPSIGEDVTVWQRLGSIFWLEPDLELGTLRIPPYRHGIAQILRCCEVGVEPILPLRWHDALRVCAATDGWDHLPRFYLVVRPPAGAFFLGYQVWFVRWLGNDSAVPPPRTELGRARG